MFVHDCQTTGQVTGTHPQFTHHDCHTTGATQKPQNEQSRCKEPLALGGWYVCVRRKIYNISMNRVWGHILFRYSFQRPVFVPITWSHQRTITALPNASSIHFYHGLHQSFSLPSACLHSHQRLFTSLNSVSFEKQSGLIAGFYFRCPIYTVISAHLQNGGMCGASEICL